MIKAEQISKTKATPRKSRKYFFGATKKLPNKLNVPSKIPPKIAPIPTVAKKENIEKEKEKPSPKTLLKKPFQEIKSTSKNYKKHKSPEKVKDEKYNAALLPSAKANKSVANRHHLDVIPEEKKDFNKSDFGDKLQTQIEDTIKKATDAKKIGEDGVAAKDTDEISNSLQKEKEAAGGKIESGTITPPGLPVAPTNEVTQKEPVSLLPEKLEKKTETKQKSNLAPAKKQAAETDLTKENKSLDDKYANNNLSKEKLQNSNEPSFINADNQKEESQAKAVELTKEVRTNEKNTINATKSSNSTAINAAYNEMLNKNSDSKTEIFSSQSKESIEENAIRDTIQKELDGIYTRTNDKVLECFSTIDNHVENIFGKKITDNLNIFSARVNQLIDDNDGWEWLGKVVTNQHIQDDVEIFDIAKKEFVNNMQKPINDLVKVVDANLLLAAEAVKNGKIEKDKFWKQQPDKDKKIAGDIFDEANSKFESLESSVKEKENSVIEAVTEKFSAALKELDDRFEKAKIENMSWWDRAVAAIMAVINTIIELKNAIKAIAKKAAKYAEQIIDDPITFFGNLADAVGQGFTNFKNNIDKHLIKGVLDWLTGSMAGTDIVLPKEFNLEGITSLVLQILGISIKKIKEIVIDVIGEERFAFIEKGVDSAISAGNKILNIFKILNEKGLAGLWEFIKEEFGNLKEMLIENVKTFVVETIAFKAVEYLLSLLIPGAGFIRAAQLLIKFVITLFQKAGQILKIIEGIIDSFGDILNKNLAAATEKVEAVFGNFLSLAISFLAAVLGLNGIVAKVRSFIQKKLRPLIDKALKKIAQKIKAIADKIGLTKLIDASMKAVEKGKAWVDEKKEKAKDAAVKYGGKFLELLGLKKKFTNKSGETHTLYFEEKGSNLNFMMASTPKTMATVLGELKVEHKSHQIANEATLMSTIIPKVETESAEVDRKKSRIKELDDGTEVTKNKTMSQKIGKEISGNLNAIADNLSNWPGGSRKQLESKVVFSPIKIGNNILGKKMSANPLSLKTPTATFGTGSEEITINGSVPQAIAKTNIWNFINKKEPGKYVQGHLLNHNLNGPGNREENLTPISKSLNSRMEGDVESHAKGKVLGEGKNIKYEVEFIYKDIIEEKFSNNIDIENEVIDSATIKQFLPHKLKYALYQIENTETKEEKVIVPETTISE